MFTVASLACGLSSNLAMLIAMRTIQGVFGGPMIPLSQSLLLNNYPADRKSLALALLHDGDDRRAGARADPRRLIHRQLELGLDFYINVPVGIVATLLHRRRCCAAARRRRRACRPTSSASRSSRLGIGSLQIMLDRGEGPRLVRLRRDRRAGRRRPRRAGIPSSPGS